MAIKILLLSFILGTFLFFAINSYYPGDIISNLNQAALKPVQIENSFIPVLTTGNIVVYIIVVGAVYLFLRGVIKTFER